MMNHTLNRIVLSAALAAIFLGMFAGNAAGAVSIDMVPVGNPNNVANPVTGYGAVDYNYQISTCEITVAAYTAFLNAVASESDPYGLSMTLPWQIQGGDGIYVALTPNQPIGGMSWGNAARFCNWMHNGQPTGVENLSTTEDGSYYLNGTTSRAGIMSVTRKANASWVIPTTNEWYKAAYYDPNKTGGAGYWMYPTKSDTAPINTLPDTGNNANLWDRYGTGNGSYTLDPPSCTDAGTFASSKSAYGTLDQAGNLFEWCETATDPNTRSMPGGGYLYDSDLTKSSNLVFGYYPESYDGDVGFRIACVANAPSTMWNGGYGTTPTSWDVAANWAPSNSAPDGPGIKITFGKQSTGNNVVDMVSIGRTVGSISFADTASTTIQSTGGFSLTLDNGGALSTIDVEGSHTISAPVAINNDVEISGSGMLDLSGGISGNHTLTVLGNLTATSIEVDTLVIGSAGANAVPEPSALVMVCLGAIGLLASAWRRES